MCVCVHIVNDGDEHLLCLVCRVGVVSPDSGCHHPGVFSFARTLLFGILSLKTFGKHAFTLKGVCSRIYIYICMNLYICVSTYAYLCICVYVRAFC